MKNFVLSILLMLFIPLVGKSQGLQNISVRKWKVSHFGFSAGEQGDRYSNMSLDFMESRVKDSGYSRKDLSGLKSHDYHQLESGKSINAFLRFSLGSPREFITTFDEMEVSVGVNLQREIMIDYQVDNLKLSTIAVQKNDPHSLTFCDLQNEFSLGFAYNKGYIYFQKLKVYSGLGIQLGTTVGSQFWIFGDPYFTTNGDTEYHSKESFNSKESMIGRVYVPLGIDFIVLKQMHMGAELKMGYGYHKIYGGPGLSNLNYSILFHLGFNL